MLSTSPYSKISLYQSSENILLAEEAVWRVWRPGEAGGGEHLALCRAGHVGRGAGRHLCR